MRCKKCDEFIWDWEPHQCEVWQFKHKNWGDDWQDRSFKKYWDHEQVAEKLADTDFFDDSGDLHGFEFKVEVKSPKGIVKKLTVTGEYDVLWSAREQ